MSDQAMQPPVCYHVYASHHEPGHLVYWVRQCMVCHAVDWDDLDEQIRADNEYSVNLESE